jgi:hypothetical protein
LLIGAGILLMLENFGKIETNAWYILARLWPLLLILIGIEILLGRTTTFGWVLSGLLAVLIVGGLLGLLVFTPDLPILQSLTAAPEIQQAAISEPLGDITQAQVTLDWGPGENTLDALPDASTRLIEGSYIYYGDLIYNFKPQDETATLRLGWRSVPGSFIGDLPQSLALHPSVLYALTLDTGSGKCIFDLSGLTLSSLNVDAGSGSVELSLPGGDYRVEVDAGSGKLVILLPAGAAAQVELDKGSGDFVYPDSLRLVRGAINDDGTYQTTDFYPAAPHLFIHIEGGAGLVEIKIAE